MTYFNNLEYSFKRIYELKNSIDIKETKDESNLTDAQKELDQNTVKLLKLQNEFNEVEKSCLEYQDKLSQNEKLIDKLNNDFDNLSLQIKIVFIYSKNSNNLFKRFTYILFLTKRYLMYQHFLYSFV
jgi:hypothetical protein